MNHPKFIASYQLEESISIQRVIYETKKVVSDEIKNPIILLWQKKTNKQKTPIL